MMNRDIQEVLSSAGGVFSEVIWLEFYLSLRLRIHRIEGSLYL